MSERPNGSPGTEEHDQTAARVDSAEEMEEQSTPKDATVDPVATLQAELEAQKTEHAAVHEKYVRLFAEFDNFRKRTAKERLELIMMAGAETVRNILPVMDDLQRAIATNETVDDVAVVKEGIVLIDQKLRGILSTQGVKAMESKGKEFDPEWHEAITKAPAPSDDLKGKVIEVIEPGYTLNDRVLRYAKVVVGE